MTGGGVPTEALSITTRALLVVNEAQRRASLDPSVVDVSHGEGVPIGTLGSGHSVFGRSGFQRLAFGGPPDTEANFRVPHAAADFGFQLVEDGETLDLQQRPLGTARAATVDRVFSYAELPKGHFRFEKTGLGLGIVMTAFSPLVPHDVETSSTPVQVFDLTVENSSSRTRSLELRLTHVSPLDVQGDRALLRSEAGELAFAVASGSVDERGPSVRFELEPGRAFTARFFVAWYFPRFETPSPAAPATYRRAYTKRFADATSVIRFAREHADQWLARIDAWHASFEVPPRMKRLWFSSLSSVITSTMLSDDPYFFGIEVPHEWVNTMDVAVYANWVYLVNWPELERLDLEQWVTTIATDGERSGFVLHSLWSDAAHYSEEPTFLTRVWRAHLWFSDREWLARSMGAAVAAANYAYRQAPFEHLLTSERGNQSYDEWMMPGASAYVNVAWLCGLHALSNMARSLGVAVVVGDHDVDELSRLVRGSLIERLWTDEAGGYFRCFHRTPGASDASVPDAIFTDQLFGLWVIAIEDGSEDLLGRQRAAAALHTIHDNNLVENRSLDFRGWVNGMLPGRKPDAASGYHARTCWLGAQLTLASLLGAVGDEASSLNVFRSVEGSLGRNHLAVGEWNRAIDADGHVVVLDEWSKDTPRFPPYPRYTACWEYLIRMLGLTMDERYLYLRPFRSLRFALHDVALAGVTLSVRVEPNWNQVLLDGAVTKAPVKLARSAGRYRIEFVVL